MVGRFETQLMIQPRILAVVSWPKKPFKYNISNKIPAVNTFNISSRMILSEIEFPASSLQHFNTIFKYSPCFNEILDNGMSRILLFMMLDHLFDKIG